MKIHRKNEYEGWKRCQIIQLTALQADYYNSLSSISENHGASHYLSDALLKLLQCCQNHQANFSLSYAHHCILICFFTKISIYQPNFGNNLKQNNQSLTETIRAVRVYEPCKFTHSNKNHHDLLLVMKTTIWTLQSWAF